MLVQVKWKNGNYDYVRDLMLDCLLETDVVDSFLRSSGWVTVGVDPVRSSSSSVNRGYNGPERRSTAPSSAAAKHSPC